MRFEANVSMVGGTKVKPSDLYKYTALIYLDKVKDMLYLPIQNSEGTKHHLLYSQSISLPVLSTSLAADCPVLEHIWNINLLIFTPALGTDCGLT